MSSIAAYGGGINARHLSPPASRAKLSLIVTRLNSVQICSQRMMRNLASKLGLLHNSVNDVAPG
jgi:hypothetical protein